MQPSIATNEANARTVRVFISSTFRDMEAERDVLVTIVFPELRERLLRLGLDFFDVDLRWGVPQGGVDGERANSWDYCRQWIERVEPFFLCMLGQRYGWVPSPNELSHPDGPEAPFGLSITEMEVRHALLRDTSRLRSFFYFRSSEVPREQTATTLYQRYVDEASISRVRSLKEDVRSTDSYSLD
jgi:hypothetical protein